MTVVVEKLALLMMTDFFDFRPSRRRNRAFVLTLAESPVWYHTNPESHVDGHPLHLMLEVES